MASVTSLDKDLRRMRLDKYTPAAANEVRQWIEDVLGTHLADGDLLKALKDGTALCQLVNLAIPPPGVKCKKSNMPFVQMENVSHFLRACQSPPLNLQEHDMFLTVDLYESKDPAQVLQCLLAFSRAANRENPSKFPTAIGGRGAVSPQRTGPASPTITPAPRGRGLSNASSTASSTYGARPPLTASKTGDSVASRWNPNKSPTQNGSKSPSVSSWSARHQEGVTSPAWNIAQYGYMGGASQGNLGVSFGGRRQITSAGPAVPSAAEKEKQRKAKEAEEARQKQQMEEESARRRADLEAEEERARLAEEQKWEQETERLRQQEKHKVEEDKRRWEEEERQWRITEEKRHRDEEEAERRLAQERSMAQGKGDPQLRGQFLSQYKAENGMKKSFSHGDRIKELEKELELARQREADYERERHERHERSPKKSGDAKARARSRSRPPMAERTPSRQDSWARDEREVLQTAWDHQPSARPGSRPGPPPRQSSRPLPDPATAATPPPAMVKTHRTGESVPEVRSHNTGSRPLPDPTAYAAKSPNTSRTPLPVPAHQAPPQQQPTYSRELGATAERDAEDRRRHQSQARTKAGHVASKSLLEREMEMERQRQREWEEAQKETAKARPAGDGVDGIGGGIGGRWDVGQWSGFTGGDTQNRGAQGIGAGRRQIVGPRPLPGTPGGGGR